MDTKTKNIIYAAIVIIVLILIASSVYKGSGNNPAAENNASSTDNVVATGDSAGTKQSGSSNTYTFKSTSGTKTTPPAGTPAGPNLEDNAVLATVISNALVHVPQTDADVTLTAGGANYSDISGRTTGHIQAGKILGWAKTENGYDVFTDMTVTKDGQPQILHYVALFYVVSPTNVKFTSSVLIGDRLPVTSAVARPDPSKQLNPSKTIMNSTLGYLLTVNYLNRKNAEPITATPSLAETVDFTVKNHRVSK